MTNEAIIINSYYAKLKIASKTSKSVDVSLISTKPESPVFDNGDVIFSDIDTNRQLFFQEVGTVKDVYEKRFLRYDDLEDWPNRELANRYYRELDKVGVSDSKPLFLYKLRVGDLEALEGPNYTLDRLSYSLLSVDRYSKPLSHFQHQVRKINYFDFETIRNGWVYLARTTFAKIANALPLTNRIELRLWIDKAFGYEQALDINYIDYFELVYEYLERRIFSRGRLLIAIEDMISEVFPELSEYEKSQIGLLCEEQRPDEISAQAQRFRRMFGGGKEEMLQELQKEVHENQKAEERFANQFVRQPLPLIWSA